MPSEDSTEIEVLIRDVEKSFDGVRVLQSISLEVARGELFVIMGPSGSGKSVLLKTIAGLETADKGDISIRGQDVTRPGARSDIRLAMVFQAGALFNSMTVFDNLALYPAEHRLYSRKEIEERVMEKLRMLSLEDAAGKLPAELSGGMKKRVAIARALVMEPELILYDEPTSELDPIMGATISEIIADLNKELGVTTLVVSHDRDLALTIAHRVGILMDGELLAVDTPANVKNSDNQAIKEFLNPVIDTANPRFKKTSQKP